MSVMQGKVLSGCSLLVLAFGRWISTWGFGQCRLHEAKPRLCILHGPSVPYGYLHLISLRGQL
jgi:hypothetical protein